MRDVAGPIAAAAVTILAVAATISPSLRAPADRPGEQLPTVCADCLTPPDPVPLDAPEVPRTVETRASRGHSPAPPPAGQPAPVAASTAVPPYRTVPSPASAGDPPAAQAGPPPTPAPIPAPTCGPPPLPIFPTPKGKAKGKPSPKPRPRAAPTGIPVP